MTELSDRVAKLLELGWGYDHVGAVIGIAEADVAALIADPNASVRNPASALQWRGQWSPDGVDYLLGDLTADTDGGLYACIRPHVSRGQINGNQPMLGPQWLNACTAAGIPSILLAEIPIVDGGLVWEDVPLYDPARPYVRGNIIRTAGNFIKQALQDSTGQAPVDTLDGANAYWGLNDSGGIFQGAYDGGTGYTPGQVVTEGGALYFCIAPSTGNDPASDGGTHWLPLPGACTYRGDWAPDVDYVLNDVVHDTTGGQVWLCDNPHHSADTIPALEPSIDASNGHGTYWDLLVKGVGGGGGGGGKMRAFNDLAAGQPAV